MSRRAMRLSRKSSRKQTLISRTALMPLAAALFVELRRGQRGVPDANILREYSDVGRYRRITNCCLGIARENAKSPIGPFTNSPASPSRSRSRVEVAAAAFSVSGGTGAWYWGIVAETLFEYRC